MRESPEHQVSASSLNKLNGRLQKDKREISVDILLCMNVSMISFTDMCDRLAVMG